MIKVLFICHGNICRSTMAQYVFQNLINRYDLIVVQLSRHKFNLFIMNRYM